MLWFKALHIVFMVTWFAGLFYLPRLFIYHAVATDEISLRRFEIMERRLFAIMTIGAVLTALFGVALLLAGRPGLVAAGWMQLKLLLVVGLVGFHLSCWRVIAILRSQPDRYSQTWLRWYNEVPGLFLIAIVLLAILKPAL